MRLKNYSVYSINGPNTQRPSGGSTVLVRNDVIHSHLVTDTNLQTVAVRLTLCSFYISPDALITLQALDTLTSHITPPYMLLGDFNGHNPLWGGSHFNAKGKVLEELITKNTLCLWNEGSHTYLHPGHGTYSAIYLSICDPEILLDFSRKVWDNLCGSDHFPIIMTSTRANFLKRTPKWKANWDAFQNRCNTAFSQIPLPDWDPAQSFTKTLISIAEETIQRTSANPHRRTNPWFDDN